MLRRPYGGALDLHATAGGADHLGKETVMYIGLGTIVLIIVIVAVVMMLRRG
ncbi:hypothetical protein OHB00_07190 [Streptomyces sp. NBC_00631]|uniref:hypothetical protein n=1 Tax=Streptomyces sp. NBC_00631 TaxID=2975793 RepID=UPI0030E1DF01